MPIYLASRSPRRVALLAQMGLDCTVLPADIDETVLANETPQDYVLRLARAKAHACIAQNSRIFKNNNKDLTSFDRHMHHDARVVVLAADTTVAIGDEILGKPDDDADAYQMLRKLSGTQHAVFTGIAGVLIQASGLHQTETALSSTWVQMMALTDQQIQAYIATHEPHDKAGSYGIQGIAGTWVTQITGTYTGVMGLPMYETAQILRTFGVYPL